MSDLGRAPWKLNLLIVRIVLLYLLIVLPLWALSAGPEKRVGMAMRTQNAPKVDGRLDDAVWKIASPMTGFREFIPSNGKAASERTEVRIIYTENSLFVGAKLFDTKAGEISKQMGDRDSWDDVNADLFGIGLDTYNDDQNAFLFFVSAVGVQTDVRVSQIDEDEVWDAVWNSAVQIDEDGWSVEMEIPYSAIRFPARQVQTWGIQFRRDIRRTRQTFTWNYQGRDIDGDVNQFGELQGVYGVDPPLRLSILPYVSYYRQYNSSGKNSNAPTQSSGIFNAGADLKYGLSESFTLDVTLVPDFGQVVSDNQVLNLSPFEVRFDENRPFFTEGTELFNIAGIFYSRRIGAAPRKRNMVTDSLTDGESILSNPGSTQLINAFKLSGRTKKKTGIGFFNAMTRPTHALVGDGQGESREVETQAFTNYNVMVVDQSLAKNSLVSIINTNRIELDGFMANTTAARLRFADNNNNWFLFGQAATSQRWEDIREGDADGGFKYYYEAGKNNGNFTFNFGQNVESHTYNPNDMGFLMAPNEFTDFMVFRYNIYRPIWKLVGQYNQIYFTRQSLFKPYRYQNFNINYRSSFQLKTFDFMGVFAFANPGDRFDYFESRTGQVMNLPGLGGLGGFLSTNYARKWALDLNYETFWQPGFDRRNINFGISPRYRVSDRLQFIHDFYYEQDENTRGFVTFDSDGRSLIGVRDRKDMVNTFTTAFSFTSRMNLNFRLRHYWSRVSYDDILELQSSGELAGSDYDEDHNINFNVFNIDCVFRWRFAPGSDLFVVWKNSILEAGSTLINSFPENLNNTFDAPQTNSISVRLLYYIDFARLGRKGGFATSAQSKP